MRLQLTTVVATRRGDDPLLPIEVEVEAPHGAMVGELAAALVDAVQGPRSGTNRPSIWVAGQPVDGGCPVGTSPLVDGAAVTLDFGPAPTLAPSPPPARTPVSVSVTHGPDAGRTVELVAGVHTLGRGAEASIVVDDPRISRLHAALTVSADSLTVVDLASTNGTHVDGDPVGGHPLAVRVGATIRVGDSVLALRTGDGVPAAVTARGDGTLSVNRRPRLHAPTTPRSIALPSAPAATHRTRVPWVAMLLPLPVAGVMALLLGPMMLAFAVMSPLLMTGTVIGDRIANRRSRAAEHAAYRAQLRAAEERITAACEAEARLLRSSLPDPALTLAIATTPTAQVWERRLEDDDSLTVSIGSWSTPASLRVSRPTDDDGPQHPVLEGVPCALALGDLGVTGLCGDREAVMGAVRAMLGQLATLHSPLDLELVLVTGADGADQAWSWLGRLPHVRDPDGHQRQGWLVGLDEAGRTRAGVAALAECVRQRLAREDGRVGPWSGPRTLLLLDGAAALRGLPDLAEVVARGPSVGISVLAINQDRAGLPSETRGILDLTAPSTPVLRMPGAPPARLVVDKVGPWWADRLSRGLAPLRDATPGARDGAPPRAVGLRDLLGLTRDSPEAITSTVVAGWSRSSRVTSVPIGRTSEGLFRIDLASDGPHVLVAGTTGAGKSELLRTLVASLAVHNRPEHLSMVLIDYKGGAAFRDCAALPHVAAVVTDLDDHLAARALTSLRAELKRRERFLAAAGEADFVSYQGCSASTSSPLARLVIVIDEFRALAEELPPFVDGMVQLAALGRSLGVHVVLATQRPAGVVTAAIKANVNLRIGLRLRDRADSDDVIDAPDAAALAPSSPGRAFARVGGGRLVTFQAAHAGASSTASRASGIRARRLPWDGDPLPWPGGANDDRDATTDLCRVVVAVSSAAALVGARPAVSPWLPALPERLDLQSLPRSDAPMRFPIGLADEPAAQHQRPVEVALDQPGHWGFVGGTGSGRSTALLTMASSATSVVAPTHLHLYAVSAGSLAPLERLPHCGAQVDLDDLPRLDRLVARLSADVSHRRRQLTARGHTSMEDWRRIEPTTAPPALLLLIDDWDLLAERADELNQGRLAPRILGLLREGAGVGLTAVLAGDRALLVGRASSVLAHRVLLRMNDRTDLLLAGLPASSVPAEQLPGRGVLDDGREVQIAVPLPFTDSGPMDGASAGVGGAEGGRRPWRVDALPRRVQLETLPQGVGPGDSLMVGMGGDELAPLGLSPHHDGRRWLVTGGNGSGVSTTLATIVTGLLAQHRPVVVVACRTVAWGALREDSHVHWCESPDRIDELVALRRRFPQLAVVVDDADQLLDTPFDVTLRELSALVDRDRGLVVVGARADALSLQYRGIAVAVARHHTGVLLGPATPTDADLLGARVPVDRAAGPGRGYLVRGGGATAIQVACPRPPTQTTSPRVAAGGGAIRFRR